MIKVPENFAFLWKLPRKRSAKTPDGTAIGERPSSGAATIAVPAAHKYFWHREEAHLAAPEDGRSPGAGSARIRFPTYRFIIPPWMFWITMLLLGPHALFGEERVDRSLVPSIFAPESTPAHSISNLAGFVLSITGVMFVLVAGLLTYVVIRYRRRANDDGIEPAQVYGSGPVEAAWTTVPFLIVVVLTLSTARVIQEIQDARKPASALEVQIIGKQWWWEIRYPKLGIVTANELHVPVSQGGNRLPTFLDLRAADVVHSFWVPRLMGKIDLVPNKVNSMWIEPERAGLFVGQCGTYCGTQHAKMLLRVYADTPEEFDRWVKQQKEQPANDPTVAAGRLVFERTACINCHAIGGSAATDRRFGPDLTHLMSRNTLASGAVSNSSANLRAWIKSPDQFKPGVLMPAMNVSDSDLDQLVAYLTTLK
jgi:cytochrome c oxidase subunit 2